MSLKVREEVEVKEKVNKDTGEITTEVERTTKAVGKAQEEPNYIKLYLKAWCDFKQAKGVNHAFLFELLHYMTYADNGQKIVLNGWVKKEISKKLNWSIKTYQSRFDAEIRKLVKTNVLKRIARSVFSVNPELIGKGNWQQVNKFRAVFNLIGINAGTIEPIIETKESD